MIPRAEIKPGNLGNKSGYVTNFQEINKTYDYSIKVGANTLDT